MKHAISILALSFYLLTACQSPKLVYENALCIENITVIDPIAGLQEQQTVIIKNGKIETIAPSLELQLAAENNRLDGTGKYMIPGLWDAHVHFAYIEDLAPNMLDLFLAYGVTSIRDTGGRINFVKKWQEKANRKPNAAPRVMIAGPLLDGMPNVYDGSSAGRPPLSVGLGSVEAVTEQINYLDSIGVDLLKAYEMLTPAQFRQVISLAKEKNLKVTGHVPLSMDVIQASNAGLNSMEHLRNLELSCASNSDELLQQRQQLLAIGKDDAGGILRTRIHDAQRRSAIENYSPERADSVLAVLAKNETWQIPTLSLSVGLINQHFAREDWVATFAYLPDSIGAQWTREAAETTSLDVPPFRKDYAQWMLDIVGKIHEAKIDIMAGTDCPIFYLTPGYSLHEELVLLVQSGLSPLEALKTATLNPARYFGMEDELGTISAGKWADLLILNANPLEDIGHTKVIDAVIKQGTLYDRVALDGMLDALKNK